MNARLKRSTATPVDAANRPTSTEDALAILDAMSDCGIDTVAAARAYLTIAVHGPRTMVQIAREVGLPVSTASRLVWNLSELGLIEYTPHPTDRRKKILVLA